MNMVVLLASRAKVWEDKLLSQSDHLVRFLVRHGLWPS